MTGTAATCRLKKIWQLRQDVVRDVDLDGELRKKRENHLKNHENFGLGLEDRLSSKVGLLSGGQRQAIIHY